MTNPLVPQQVSLPLASRLTSRSARSLRAVIARGELAAAGDTIRYIPMKEIERLRGSAVSLTDWATADRAHDRERQRHRNYRQQKDSTA